MFGTATSSGMIILSRVPPLLRLEKVGDKAKLAATGGMIDAAGKSLHLRLLIWYLAYTTSVRLQGLVL